MEPKVGQVWADNDSRSAGRTLRIDSIDLAAGKAVCTILSNSDECQQHLDGAGTAAMRSWYRYRDTRGKTTSISLSRFRPTRTGYRCIGAEQYGIRWPTGSVFAFPSREAAEAGLVMDGRRIGVLVVHEYEPDTSNRTEWREVSDGEPEEG